VREEKVDGLGDEAIDEEAVIFLRLTETHLVHVVPTAEKLPLGQAHHFRQGTAYAIIDGGDSIEETLVTNGGENGLVELGVDEAFLIEGHQLLREGCSAPGRGDNENWLLHLLLAKARVNDVIHHPAKGHEEPHHPIKGGEKEDKSPSPQPEWRLEQRQVLRSKEQFEVDVHFTVNSEYRA
jgi:hypothetical protein